MSGVMDPSDRVPLPACLPEFEEESRRATGLSDFGPGEYREGLACFLEACEKESNLTPAGRLTVKEQVVTGLKGSCFRKRASASFQRRLPARSSARS